MRDLFGVVSSDNSIERGYLITSGKISRESRNFAKDNRLTLMDGLELRVLLKKYGLI